MEFKKLPSIVDCPNSETYVDYNVASQVGQVGDHVAILVGNLRVLDQFGEVLFGDAFKNRNDEEMSNFSPQLTHHFWIECREE